MDITPLTFIIVVIIKISGSDGTCPSASLPADNQTTLYQSAIAAVPVTYSQGQVVLFLCKPGVGFGHVYYKCMSNGAWSLPNRICTDVPPVEGGSVFGIIVAILTTLVAAFAAFMSSKTTLPEYETQTSKRPSQGEMDDDVFLESNEHPVSPVVSPHQWRLGSVHSPTLDNLKEGVEEQEV